MHVLFQTDMLMSFKCLKISHRIFEIIYSPGENLDEWSMEHMIAISVVDISNTL